MKALCYAVSAVVVLTMIAACGGSSGTNSTPVSSTAPAVSYAQNVAVKAGVGYGWGGNWFGQLGSSNLTYFTAPVAISGVYGMQQLVTGGDHTLAAVFSNVSSGVRAFGNNGYGQLGNNSTTASSTPVRVVDIHNVPLRNVIKVAAGGSHSLAITSDKSVWSWGYNGYGQLGAVPGTTFYSSQVAIPVMDQQLGIPLVAEEIAAGGGHSLALKSDKSLWSWGLNYSGQLGNGDVTLKNSASPVKVLDVAGAGYAAFAAGGSHSLAVDVAGTVWAWGYNGFGQLGHNNISITQSVIPVKVLDGATMTALAGVKAVSAGLDHSLALDAAGTIWAWGRNYYGQLGNGVYTDQHVAVKVTGFPVGTTISRILALGNCSYAFDDSTGMIWAWGSNNFGQLGNGSVTYSAVPVRVSGFP